jgi:hypothetical protein
MHGEFPWWWSSSLRWWYSTALIEVDLAPPLRWRGRRRWWRCYAWEMFWEIRMRRDVCLRWKYECSYIVERGRWRSCSTDCVIKPAGGSEAFGDRSTKRGRNGDWFRSVVAS